MSTFTESKLKIRNEERRGFISQVLPTLVFTVVYDVTLVSHDDGDPEVEELKVRQLYVCEKHTGLEIPCTVPRSNDFLGFEDELNKVLHSDALAAAAFSDETDWSVTTKEI